jgi:cell division protease FtsH
MSENLGAVTFQQGEPHPFLGRELTQAKDFSEHTAQLIDEEIQKIVGKMEQKAAETLTDNRKKLDALAEELLKHETLTRRQVDKILAKAEGLKKKAAKARR